MLFIVKLTDREGTAALRQQHLAAHRRWLAEHAAVIRVTGALRKHPADNPIGGLWIVEAEAASEIEQLLQQDPFWIHGLRAGYEIWHWSRGFPDNKIEL